MNLNKVFILGRLTQDPQIRSLPSGDLVATFGVATNRVFYNKNKEKQEQTEFHNVVLFGKLADIAKQYLKQGSMVLIEGRLQTRSWEDKDGIKKYRTEIIGESLQLGPKSLSPSSSSQENETKVENIPEEEIPTVEEEEINVQDLPL
jgi:single-strand DNA-binding protein